MAKKIRIIMTQVIEYEPNPKHYGDVTTYEEMANIDESTDDLDLLFDRDDNKVTTTWEIIEKSEDGSEGLVNSKEHWERTGKVTKIQ